MSAEVQFLRGQGYVEGGRRDAGSQKKVVKGEHDDGKCVATTRWKLVSRGQLREILVEAGKGMKIRGSSLVAADDERLR